MGTRSTQSTVISGLVFKKLAKEEDVNVPGALGVYTAVTRVALTPVEVGANTCAEQDFTIAELADLDTNDFVAVTKPTAQAGLGVVNVRVKSAGVLAITYVNATGAGITPTAETYIVKAERVG